MPFRESRVGGFLKSAAVVFMILTIVFCCFIVIAGILYVTDILYAGVENSWIDKLFLGWTETDTIIGCFLTAILLFIIGLVDNAVLYGFGVLIETAVERRNIMRWQANRLYGAKPEAEPLPPTEQKTEDHPTF